MTTANDIVSGALRLISSVTPGEAISGEEAANALTILNDMIASWSAESNMPPFKTKETLTLVQNQQSYVIGTSGSPDFNTVRPDEIIDVYFTDTTANIDYDGDFLTQEQYNGIALKSVGTIPHWLYYDPQYPNGKIYIYPVPGNTTFTMTIESLKPVAQFSALTSTLSLPGEYPHALKMLLADVLSFEYGFEKSPSLQMEIERCRSLIKAKNAKRVTAGFDPIFRRKHTFSILTG
jgi:hypothetical protein